MEVTLLTREDMARTLERLAYEVLERHHGADELLLVGIQRRGVDLARRLARILGERVGRDIPLGTLDINLYRDDWTSLSAMPALGASSIPLPLEGRQVILVDDVLYTGRTVRAALEGILDYAPTGWSFWCWWTEVTANCPFMPIMWGAASIPRAPNRSTCFWKNATAWTKCG